MKRCPIVRKNEQDKQELKEQGKETEKLMCSVCKILAELVVLFFTFAEPS